MKEGSEWFDGIFQEKKWIAKHHIEDSGTDKRGTGCRYGSTLLAELLLHSDWKLASAQAQKGIIEYRNSSSYNEGIYQNPNAQ